MNETIKQQLKAIRILYLGLIIGALAFLIISIGMVAVDMPIGEDMGKDFFYLFLLIANIIGVSSLAAGLTVFKHKMKGIEELGLFEKIIKYREAIIIRAATMEGPAFFFIVGYFLLAKPVFAIEAFAFLLILVFFFPTNARIAKEIRHDQRELVD